MQNNKASDNLKKDKSLEQGISKEKLKEQMEIMSFGARLLGTLTDRKLLIDNTIETISTFCKSRRVAVLTLENENKNLRVEGLSIDHKPQPNDKILPCKDPFLKHVLSIKIPDVYSLRLDNKVPLPSGLEDNTTKKCLCLPLVDTFFETIGMVVIETTKKNILSTSAIQMLYTFSTIFSLSLQNALLFSKILYDGLTGLFVRQYYEVRIEEELSKLKRHPGSIAIALIDIDNYKSISGTFGQEVANKVLVEFSNILKINIRKGTSIVCRYENERFVILMSNTPLNGSLIVAERIRSLCSKLDFSGIQNLKVTASVGLSSTDSEKLITADDLLNRAQAMLEKAKKNGGNQTMIWPDTVSS